MKQQLVDRIYKYLSEAAEQYLEAKKEKDKTYQEMQEAEIKLASLLNNIFAEVTGKQLKKLL